MKHLRKFNENANRPGPNAGSKSITISQDEVNSFSTEPSLQKLIADEKVSVIGTKAVSYTHLTLPTKRIV